MFTEVVPAILVKDRENTRFRDSSTNFPNTVFIFFLFRGPVTHGRWQRSHNVDISPSSSMNCTNSDIKRVRTWCISCSHIYTSVKASIGILNFFFYYYNANSYRNKLVLKITERPSKRTHHWWEGKRTHRWCLHHPPAVPFQCSLRCHSDQCFPSYFQNVETSERKCIAPV